jgi:hypothetical protein
MSRLTGMLCLFLACGTAPSATRVALVTASSQDRPHNVVALAEVGNSYGLWLLNLRNDKGR